MSVLITRQGRILLHLLCACLILTASGFVLFVPSSINDSIFRVDQKPEFSNCFDSCRTPVIRWMTCGKSRRGKRQNFEIKLIRRGINLPLFFVFFCIFLYFVRKYIRQSLAFIGDLSSLKIFFQCLRFPISV